MDKQHGRHIHDPMTPLSVAALVLRNQFVPIYPEHTRVKTVLADLLGERKKPENRTTSERFGYGIFALPINGHGCDFISLETLIKAGGSGDFLSLKELEKRSATILQESTSFNEAVHQISLCGLGALPVATKEGKYALITATQLLEAQAARNAATSATLAQKTEKLSTINHALRVHLAAIECQCELIRWQFAHSPYLQEKQKRIRGSCQEINQYLQTQVQSQKSFDDDTAHHDLAESAETTLSTDRISLPLYLNKLAAELQAIASSRGTTMVLDVSTPINLVIHSERLKRALVQLVSDYLTAMHTPTSLTLMSTFESDDLPLEASGEQSGTCRLLLTGTIKNADALASLQHFKTKNPQPKNHDSVLNQSLSLSLQHVRSVAEQHGGYFEHEINHHSVSFIVTLPRASLTPPPPTASRKLVVVVDDDVELQEFLCTALERHGYRVIGVNDGFDALIAIERYRPDIVISDVIMPNMSGLDLTSRVKQSMDLPVILVTGYYKDLAGLKQADHKPDMILSKPLEQERIVAAIETLTAKRHLSLLNLD